MPTTGYPAALGENAAMRAQRRTTRVYCIAVLFAIFASGVRAATSVEVRDTFPAGDDLTLSRNESFYIRLHYDTDRPVGIWARPFFRGKPANAGSNGSYSYTGSGEALGWFFFMSNRGEVDEIRITAGDGSRDGTSVVLSYPVHIIASEGDGTPEVEPEWVARLKARDAEQQRRAYQAYVNQPISAGWNLFMSVFMIGVLLLAVCGFVLPVRALLRWRGGWRTAAAVPAALMSFVVLRLIIGVTRDPTSHNLWPFEILMVGLASVVVMAVLMLLRKVTRAHDASGQT
jgi:hypothetical protein